MEITIKFDPSSEPVTGLLSSEAVREVPFVGFLQLLSLLERVRRGEPISVWPLNDANERA